MDRDAGVSTWPGISLAGLDEIQEQVRENGEKLAALEKLLRAKSDPPPPPPPEPTDEVAPSRDSLH